MKNGLIHIYYGNGKGKTSAAVGLAVRALGRNLKVCMVQFLKNNDSGEVISLKTFNNFTYLMNEKNFNFVWNLNDAQIYELKEQTFMKLEKVKNILNSNSFNLVILDEGLGIIEDGLVDENYILEMLSNKNCEVEVVLTGRKASESLLQIADYVSKIDAIKHPFEKGVKARKGIEY